MKYAQLVMGPAGCGKSTYCQTLCEHAKTIKRSIQVVNLDPAAENLNYDAFVDIRELVSLDDVMEDKELKFGPNGGLVFCMEYIVKNLEWLHEQLDATEDDYILFDCPGQIELYTHLNVMKEIVDALQAWDFQICGVYVIDSQFIIETSKFFAGILTALSTMVRLEVPHVNILSKMDLLNKKARKTIERYLEPDINLLVEEENDKKWGKKFFKLNKAIGKLIEDYSMVNFTPLNIKDEDSINDALFSIDNTMNYGEDEDIRTKDFTSEDKDEN